MQPVEINAGQWYLLPLRTDDWESDTAYAWAVCEPTTGEALAEVVLDTGTGRVCSRGRPGFADAAAAAEAAVLRFVQATLHGWKPMRTT